KGRLALAWDTKPEANAAEIWVMLSQDAGAAWSAPQKLSAPGVNASHPQVAATPDGFRIFWTQTAPGQSNVTWQSAPVSLTK
ncbi:MAG: sialidase family protein, partial [Chthoniobacteraceae bacterium]